MLWMRKSLSGISAQRKWPASSGVRDQGSGIGPSTPQASVRCLVPLGAVASWRISASPSFPRTWESLGSMADIARSKGLASRSEAEMLRNCGDAAIPGLTQHLRPAASLHSQYPQRESFHLVLSRPSPFSVPCDIKKSTVSSRRCRFFLFVAGHDGGPRRYS